MEKMLHKLARQLDSLDEASLMALWGKYATITSRFEPTAQWEEAALIFSLIQAKRWKNQLFNHIWSKRRQPPEREEVFFEDEIDDDSPAPEELAETLTESPPQKCRILPFISDK